jgi:hypothetical protein
MFAKRSQMKPDEKDADREQLARLIEIEALN